MLKFLIPAILLSAMLPAAASAQDGHADVHVAYRDLNLQNPDGIKLLDRRIRRAIAAVCPDYPSVDTAHRRAMAKCRVTKYAEVANSRAAVLAEAAHGGVALAAAQTAR